MWSGPIGNTTLSLFHYYTYPLFRYFYRDDDDDSEQEGDDKDFKSYTEKYIMGQWKTAVFLFCAYLLAGWLVYTRLVNRSKMMASGVWKRVLLVVAHPDDESMFFGPTLVNLTRRENPGCQVYVVCLSYGDYYDLGAVRKKELFESCSALGIPEANVTIYRCTDLPDDPDARWSPRLVARIVLQHAHLYTVDALLTFDRYGVSYHENHMSVWRGVQLAVNSSLLPVETRAYALETVNILRKYSVFFDSCLSCFTSRHVFVASFRDHTRIAAAMSAHASQYVWFRRFFIYLSRYAYINTFRPVDVG